MDTFDTETCVGFSDCPCRRCRRSRFEASEAHPNHTEHGQAAYCNPCQRAAREADATTPDTFETGDAVEVTAYRRTERGTFLAYDTAEPTRLAIVRLEGEWWQHRTMVTLDQITKAA